MKLNQKNVLARILAATDALWSPCRDINIGFTGIVVTERRQLFDASGVVWSGLRIGGSTDANRKSASRLLEDLKLSALVTAHSPNGRTLTAKLTPQGDAEARALCGPGQLAWAWPLAEMIYAHQRGADDATKAAGDPRGVDWDGRAWILETHLSERAGEPIDYGQPKTADVLFDLAERMQPLLSNRLAESLSDPRRRVWYALTDDALTRLDAGATPDFPVTTMEFDNSAMSAYVEAFYREKGALSRARPENPNEIGQIPMSASPPTRGMVAARTS